MKFLFSILWALALAVGSCVIFVGVGLISLAHVIGNTTVSAIGVSPWALVVVASVFGLVGFILGLLGKLPGTK